ncbi:MAG: choice-of-anchor D domain-containing protein [Krumholzibacteria bacterium]|nr:choice-of-anchor D domain-containing protein [Candidatus Krumholzibacteria bacterium]
MLHGRARSRSILLALILVATTAVTALGQTITSEYLPNELILRFKPHATEAQKNAILADLGAYDVVNFPRIESKYGKISNASVEDAIERYRNNPLVEFIEPNYVLTINETPDDPRFGELWGMLNTGQSGGTPGADISATSAWDVFTGSDDVVIAIIDTGLDYNHPDIAANAWVNPGEIPGNGIDDDGNGFIDDVYGWDFINDDNDPMDDNGHGTHCGGTIGGVGDNGIGVAGVNWNVKLMGLKFLSAGGSGSTADAVEAIQYATMMGVRLTSNSWGGGGYSQAMYDAIADAQANGILFVAAAGNSSTNTDASPHYPSSYDLDNVVAVAATDHNDALASFSSYGATTVDLAAPGVDILSTLPGNSYGYLSGTSMATPHVSGALGLIFGRFPAIGGADAKSLMLNFVDPVPALAGRVLTGGRLNAFMPIAEPDSIAPGQVTDLAVTTAGSNWLELGWTAPGDDDYTGEASRYDIRYSASPITDANWDAASQVNGEPDPGVAGTPETFRLAGLDFNTGYYVAVKAMDEFGNASPASNSPLGTTLGAPDVAVAPSSLSAALLTGDLAYQTLTLSNVGEGTLDFVVPTPMLLGAPTVQKAYEEVIKGADPRSGDPVAAGAGGPDTFGYRWVDSNDAMGPVFAWEDISGYGNVALTTGDDTNVGPFPLSFPFRFYGGEYSSFRVCSNGFISLTSTSTAYGNQQLPNPGAPGNLIAPFWDDLDTQAGTVYWYDDGTRVIVQWEGVSHYGSGGPYSFQAILGADGSIVYQYDSMAEPTNSATVGIQDGTGSDGLQIAFNTAYVTDGLAVRIWAIPQWVTVVPTEGTVWAPGSTTLDVTIDASGLVGGTYDGVIRILSNDPDEPDYHVPVTLDVTGAPDIEVSPLSFAFADLFLGATETTQVVVRNAGTDDLTISGITIDEPAFTADANAFVLTAGAAQVVNVTFTPTLAQPYSGTMTVNSDDPTDAVIMVSLTGAGLVPPDFAVTPTSLAADLMTGESEQQTLTFTNSGGADFEFDLSVNFHADVVVHEYVEVGKDELDLNAGQPVLLGSGGPDAYGYRWIDSDEPGGPAYNWTDIAATGTPVFSGANDDRNVGPFPIGFDFPFYGNTFSDFRVCSNGFLSFTSTLTALTNQNLPNTGAPENLLAAFWDDLNVNTANGNNVYYLYDGSKLIVQYDQVPRYGTTMLYTFQVLLYPDGTIVYQYEEMQGTRLNEATIGIQNDLRDDGLTVVYNAAYVHDGLAIRFQAFPEWLTVSPTSGVVAPGGSLPVVARFNASGLFGGDYAADIMVASNDPAAPNLAVPALLSVTGAPDIAVSTMAIDYGTVYLGTPTLRNLVISNIGTDDLELTGASISHPDFNANLTVPTVLGPTQSLIVTVGFVASATGPREGVLSLASNDPDQPVVEIALTGIGLEPPVAGVTPASLAASLLTGQQETQALTVSNTGNSDLTFAAHTLLGAAEVVVHDDVPELGKEDVDTQPGILGSGGPDVYGYRWKDSDEPGGPVFEWTDISATGTPVFAGTSDDVNTGPFPIGFTFPFYGTPFTEFRISSNGFVSFTSTQSDLSNAPLPGTGAPENLLAIFHDDLRVDPAAGNNVYYENVGNKLIVQFDQVPKYFASGALTFQAHLYPNGAIYYYYLTMTGADLTSATVGIQNATRDDGLTVVYNAPYMHDNLAIRIAPVSDWLTVNPAAGTVAPGGTAQLDVTFDAAEMFGGDYAGAVRIETNDPQAGVIEVPATLHVTGVPVLAVAPAAIDCGTVFRGYTGQVQFVATNAGTDVLHVTGMVASKSGFTMDPMVFDLDPFASQVVTVTFAPELAGVREGTLSIMSNDASSPLVLPLTGTGLNPPLALVEPEAIVGAALPGGQKIKPLKIRNRGGSDLVWTLSAAENMTAATVQYPFVEYGKDEPDPRPGILGSGGPDVFGHTWIDSDEPGGPVFAWMDISSVGTPAFGVYSDDGNRGPFPIGFDFPFYGNSFSTFNVCSNGWLSFTSTATVYTNQPLPNAGGPENLLAVFWDDMVVDPAYSREIYYYHDGGRLIVQFDLRRIAATTPPFYSMQAILYPNGNIVYQYNTLGTTTNSATIGIQNGTNDDALMVAYNSEYVHEGLAILFQAAPSWLSVSADAGTIAANGSTNLDVIMDAADLEPGDHVGALTLVSNDPANPSIVVEVVFHVGALAATASELAPDVLEDSDNVRWVMSYVELPAGTDLSLLDISTVRLNGVVAANLTHWTVEGDFNQNGIPDMNFKFCRDEIEDILPAGDTVAVEITGELADTICFIAVDSIRVIAPELTTPNGGETFHIGQEVTIRWTNPVDRTVDYANLYYTLDDGETWEALARNVVTESHVWQTPLLPSESARIRVFIYDQVGLLGSDISDEVFTVTSSLSAVDDIIPVTYALRGAFPNPFNPKTTISYDLPRDGMTKLTIYDVRGRLVRTLVSQPMPRGRHEATWLGDDNQGRQMATGVYYYRIESGTFTATKAMTLLK